MLKLIEISFCGPVNYFRDTDHPGYKSKYKKVGVLPIQTVKSNVSNVGPSVYLKYG